MPKRDDLQMQRRARTNQEPERVEQRDHDGHDESNLVGMACKLNRLKTYRVSGSHARIRRRLRLAGMLNYYERAA